MACKLPHYIEHWSREVDRWINGDEDQRYSEGTLSSTTDIETRYPPFSVFPRIRTSTRSNCVIYYACINFATYAQFGANTTEGV